MQRARRRRGGEGDQLASPRSDRVARILGSGRHPAIGNVRGEYLRVTKEPTAGRILGNVHPLPAAGGSLPFLEVHFTRTTGWDALVGPDELSLARDGYGWCEVRAGDEWEIAERRFVRLWGRTGFRHGDRTEHGVSGRGNEGERSAMSGLAVGGMGRICCNTAHVQALRNSKTA